MPVVTGARRPRGVAVVAVLLAGGCGDLFHGTDWSPCEGRQCPTSSAGAAGAGGDGAGASGGGGQGKGGGGAGGAPTIQACATYAQRVCAGLEKCLTPQIQILFADLADCEARYELQCEAITVGPGISYTPDELETCYEALFSPTRSCGTFLREAYGQIGNPACMIPGGTLLAGQPCASGGQCEEGRCDVAAGAACGVCSSFTPVGGACKGPAECTPGSTCVGGTCAALGDVDASCAAHSECFADLACVPAGFALTCQPALQLGAPCDPTLGGCAGYTYCGPSKTCEALQVAKLGDACGSLATGVTVCGYPATCEVTDPMAFTGTCVPLVELDGPCTFDGPYQTQCRYPGRCIVGSCVLSSLDECTP